MPKFEETVLIAAPRSHVFERIADYESYPDILSEMRSVRILERDENRVLVRFELDLIMHVAYTLRIVERRPETILWDLEEGKLLSRNQGGWRFDEVSPTETRAVYTLDVQLRGLLPRSVSERLSGETLPEMLRRFKEHCEATSP